MRTVNDIWFKVTAKYPTVNESGESVKVSENYIVRALTFGSAEERTTEEVSKLVNDASKLKVTKEAFAPFREVFFSEDENDDKWYLVKVNLVTIDEKTEKEKKTTITYLVQANSTAKAEKNTQEVFNRTMIDYYVSQVTEINIVDVFE